MKRYTVNHDVCVPLTLLPQGILTTLPTEQRSLLFDERVECFLWQPISVAGRFRPFLGLAGFLTLGENNIHMAI